MSQRVALIPARGGSKRLPRKNIMKFQDKPMIAYTVEAALRSECFDTVVVSTEDDDIAMIAEKYGASVDKRASDLATDQARVLDVCLDYLSQHAVDELAVLYATAPLRNSADIKAVMSLLSDDCHFAMAVTHCEWPVHQTLRYQNGDAAPLFPDLINERSNEVDEFCVDNGSTYVVNVRSFLNQQTFYGDTLKVYLMPNARSIDIDTPEDYARACFEAGRVSV